MTIYLEPNEEITSVIDHLIQTPDKEVIFVVPIGAQILQSLINLKLLKREADNLNKIIFIVTQDLVGRKLAKKAGIILDGFEKAELNVAPAIAAEDYVVTMAAHHRSGRKGQYDGEVRVRVKAEEALEFASEQKVVADIVAQKQEEKMAERADRSEEIYETQESEDFSSHRSHKTYYWIGGGAVLLAGLAYIVFAVLPIAEIVLSPKLNDVESAIQIKVDKNITTVDLASRVMPGQLINLEKNISREFPALSEKQLNEKAMGKVTIYNTYSSAPQKLVESTRFLSDNGKLFRLTGAIIVPGAKIEEGKIVPNSIEAEVAADEAGSSFNIGPANFTIPGFQGTSKYQAFYAKSSGAMTGGASGRARVVGEEEVAKAKEALNKDLKNEILKYAEKDMPGGFKLLDFALVEKSVSVSVAPEVGKQADKFTVNMKFVFRGIIFNENEVKTVVLEDIGDRLPDGQKSVDKILNLDYKKIDTNFDNGIMNIAIFAKGKSVKQFDIEDLKNKFKGKNEQGIKDIITSIDGIESAKIKLQPFWVKSAPKDARKIKIGVD